ncbi:unnamed protein product [Rotaria magnacalcarata]|uniref:Secreted protein n=1 Tax=Rotaria magnacalcarata TaxID=392030 RepID=A0A8S3H3P2_9BILA|nr:unnamed protein product [Rotaria magnacalcarata]
MKNCIIIVSLLFISSFEFSTSYQKRNHHFDRRFEQLLDILKLHLTDDFDEPITFDANNDNNPDSLNIEPQVDPNDRVNVELWNRLNAEDEKTMPTITDYSDEVTATAWLKWYFRIAQRHHQVSAHLHWNYETNITEENQKLMTAQSLLQSPFSHKVVPIAKEFNENLKESENGDLKRIFGRLATGVVSDNMVELKKASKLHAKLENIYAVAKVCESSDPGKCYALAPYLERVMQVEKDYDRLTWAWKGWHDECGNKVRPVYLSYIDLLNKNIKENGYTDLSVNI